MRTLGTRILTNSRDKDQMLSLHANSPKEVVSLTGIFWLVKMLDLGNAPNFHSSW